jgi:2-oxoglutarate dehydrogenase E1 component
MTAAHFRSLLSGFYRQHREANGALDESWQAFFDGIEGIPLAADEALPGVRVDSIRTALILGRVIEQFRWRGHMAADLDPLGLCDRRMDPELILDLAALSIGGGQPGAANGELAAIAARLKDIYCGTVGYEYMHLEDAISREWLRRRIEADEQGLPAKARIDAAKRVIEADEFEQFLQKRFVGKKVFGADGAESLLCVLWSILETGVSLGLRSAVMGGTTRARFNQLVNFLGQSPAAVFAGIKGAATDVAEGERRGDVSYHLGYSGERSVNGVAINLRYSPNPSHLEAVNTVALGRVRAMQERLGGGPGAQDAVMGLLIHTDAAFAGQGVVAEAFQLSGLRSYTAGGTIHVVINNQIGFTTEPSDGRTSRYCTDAAKGIGAPVFHVNAADPDAVLRVGRLAMEYRQRFHRDAVIDLVCYRRRGHNEVDEPSFTQPVMYRHIAGHPGTRRLYLDRLSRENIFTDGEANAFADAYRAMLANAYEATAARKPAQTAPEKLSPMPVEAPPRLETGMSEPVLLTIAKALAAIPQGVKAHPKVRLIFNQRATCAENGEDINWGFAEALALGGLISEGIPVRLSGQDTPRGAFSHRHFYVHDQDGGRRVSIFENLPEPKAQFQAIESPLAEYATLGFEYGYACDAKNALVIWEAQFGDFANVAQPVFDQFIVSGEEKWGERCRLTVLMPHGLEGQGSEHSSARIERFLQLCANGNMTVANCSTPANYFHLLRRQALFAETPLIVFTPKSLLRHKLAVSSLADMGPRTGFLPFAEPPPRPYGFCRIVLCSGKLYWELEPERLRHQLDGVGIARIEQLYPFPERELESFIERHPQAEVLWCQEEPANMGAWFFAAPQLSRILQKAGGRNELRYVGRPASPSPASGSARLHASEQSSIIREGLGS